MATSKSFWDHPVKTLEEALSIRKQIDALQSRLGSLFGGGESESEKPAKGRRQMSAASRAKIAAAARARWAKQKGTAKGTGSSAAPKKASGRKRGGLTPEGRARLAAAMKARWAARKKGAPAPNASRG